MCFFLVEQPKPILHTRNPIILFSGEVAHRVVASIEFDQDVSVACKAYKWLKLLRYGICGDLVCNTFSSRMF